MSTPGEDRVVVYEITPTHPDGFGGHVFEYDSSTDLFRCTNDGCGQWEFKAREGGGITTCPGGAR